MNRSIWFSWALLTLTAMSAQGAPITGGRWIGIDFGPDTPSNNYNKIDNTGGGSFTSFVDLTGVAVDGVGLTLGSSVTFSNSDGTSQDLANYPAELQLNDSNTTDWIGAGAGSPDPKTITLTWTGLRDDLTYDVYGVSSFSTSNLGITWLADGKSDVTVTNSASGGTLAELLGLHTDGSGNLQVLVRRTGSSTNVAVANAMILHAVPEPNGLMLSGMAALAIACLARRKKCQTPCTCHVES